jgi:hypothetical protein
LIWVLVFLEYRGFYSVFCTLLSVFVLAIK